MKKVLTSVDIFKFIAAVMVVTIHTHPFICCEEYDYWVTSACRIAVPFFFIIGSFLFFKSNKPIGTYIKRLLALYLVWFVIELPIIYERFFYNQSFFKGFLLFLRGLLINNTFYASWYITATWQATLIVYILSRLKHKHILLVGVGILCAFMSVTNSLYNNLFDNSWWNIYTSFTQTIFASNSFIAAIPYCIIGKYIAENQHQLSSIKLNNKLLIISIATLMCVLELALCQDIQLCTDSFFSLYLLAFSVSIFLISHNINIPHSIAKLLRNTSILIYLLHGIVIRVLQYILGINYGYSVWITTILISISLSYIIVILSRKYKILLKLY